MTSGTKTQFKGLMMMSKYRNLKDIYVAQLKTVPRTANTQAFHEAVATGLRAAGQLVRTTDKFRELVSNASIELSGVGEAA